MLRLIASDIDGTLVPDSAPTIKEEYFEVIRALQAKQYGEDVRAVKGRSIFYL